MSFSALPLELQTKILESSPETLKLAQGLTSQTRAITGRAYYRQYCGPIEASEVDRYLYTISLAPVKVVIFQTPLPRITTHYLSVTTSHAFIQKDWSTPRIYQSSANLIYLDNIYAEAPEEELEEEEEEELFYKPSEYYLPSSVNRWTIPEIMRLVWDVNGVYNQLDWNSQRKILSQRYRCHQLEENYVATWILNNFDQMVGRMLRPSNRITRIARAIQLYDYLYLNLNFMHWERKYTLELRNAYTNMIESLDPESLNRFYAEYFNIDYSSPSRSCGMAPTTSPSLKTNPQTQTYTQTQIPNHNHDTFTIYPSA